MGSPEIRSTISTRAGRYLTQPTGHRAFIPVPLPPDPPVQITGQLHPVVPRYRIEDCRMIADLKLCPAKEDSGVPCLGEALADLANNLEFSVPTASVVFQR
jgi:hypothetical protein